MTMKFRASSKPFANSSRRFRPASVASGSNPHLPKRKLGRPRPGKREGLSLPTPVTIAGEFSNDGCFVRCSVQFELHDSRHGGIRSQQPSDYEVTLVFTTGERPTPIAEQAPILLPVPDPSPAPHMLRDSDRSLPSPTIIPETQPLFRLANEL